jgi:hypothetical protein
MSLYNVGMESISLAQTGSGKDEVVERAVLG